MKPEKKQLGDRITADIADTLTKLGDVLGIPRQQLTEDAVAMWMGKADPMAKARREMVIKAFRNGKVERPFNQPLAPFSSNVIVG